MVRSGLRCRPYQTDTRLRSRRSCRRRCFHFADPCRARNKTLARRRTTARCTIRSGMSSPAAQTLPHAPQFALSTRRAGARAIAVRLPAQTIAVGPNTGVIAVRVGRNVFAAVAALEDTEVIEVHIGIRIEPGVGAGRVRLGNPCTQAHVLKCWKSAASTSQSLSKSPGTIPAFTCPVEEAGQQQDRKSQHTPQLLYVHHISLRWGVNFCFHRAPNGAQSHDR